jgi:5-methylthioadenosine/S-adenosylhomocysteine deaminase
MDGEKKVGRREFLRLTGGAAVAAYWGDGDQRQGGATARVSDTTPAAGAPTAPGGATADSRLAASTSLSRTTGPRTLLSGAVVVTCDEQHTVWDPGDVAIEADRIVYAGPAYTGAYDHKLQLSGRLLMPGLINAHTHTPMSLFRGLADDVDLGVFLQQRVWPREAQLTGQEAYAGSLLSAVEMLKSGVTTYVDMHFFEEDLVRAAIDAGSRAVITPGIIETPALTPVLGGWERRTARVLEFCKRWDRAEGRIHTGLGPHAPYTLPLEALGEIAGEGRRADLPLHIHLVETSQERRDFNARGLGSTVGALRDVGFFEARVLAAHSVWLDAGDIEVYAANGVGIAHCPQSNAKLAVGVAPVPALLAAGVHVGLGTDGPASNNNLNLWDELSLAPLLAKVVRQDPKVVPARDALWMATRLGALAIHQPELGVIAESYKADLVLLNLEATTMVPVLAPGEYVQHLVYSAGRELVDSVWVNGRQVVAHGEVLTVEEAKVRQAAQRAAVHLSRRI